MATGTHSWPRALEPMHATVYGEVIPDDGEHESSSEDDGGVVHVRSTHLHCRGEEEHDGRKRHPADGNKRDDSRLPQRYAQGESNEPMT